MKKDITPKKKKESTLGIEPTINNYACSLSESLPVQLLSLFHDICQIDMYLYLRIEARGRNSNFDLETKTSPSPGHDPSTAESACGRAGRDEQGEAHRANTTPNGGPHLELGLLGSKPSLNLTSRLLRRHGQHIYTYVYIY